MEIKKGAVYRDRVSGFQGVAVAVTTYLYSCDRVELQSHIGDHIRTYWFDDLALEYISSGPDLGDSVPVKGSGRTGGGPDAPHSTEAR